MPDVPEIGCHCTYLGGLAALPGFCATPSSRIPGRSDVVGAVNYFQILLTKRDYLSIRNDFLWDPQGQRTGFATVYSSHTLGWVHTFSDVLTLRPEIRYERAYADGVTPYDNGTRKDQFKFAMDFIFRF